MSNVMLATLFLLMLLAPCVISLSGWWKTDPETDAMREADEAEALQAGPAEIRLEPLGMHVAPVESVVAVGVLHADVLRAGVLHASVMAARPESLQELALQAEDEARAAKEMAKRAMSLAMSAAARAAKARARVAAERAEQAAHEAGAASVAAVVAQAAYERMLMAEAVTLRDFGRDLGRGVGEERRAA